MQTIPQEFNPFALMLDPQAIFAQIERSERLERLQRRVCRPLDKPLLGAPAEDDSLDASDIGDTSDIGVIGVTSLDAADEAAPAACGSVGGSALQG